MKKIISTILTIAILISVIPVPGKAAETIRQVNAEETMASHLKELKLFKGVSEVDFDLSRKPSRVEALVMLIRVLGKENEALNGQFNHPFTDVPQWADKYVGYAYNNKLTNGISSTQFGMSDADATMYLTFMLRALGYSDTNGLDFSWNNPYDLARYAGILPEMVNLNTFWRADVVTVSYATLQAYLKNSNTTLADKLIRENVFKKETFESIYDKTLLKKSSSYYSTAENIADKCSPAVFMINNYAINGELKGRGSGFFVDSNGIAITNYHVVSDSMDITVIMNDGTTYTDVSIINYDKNNDIAVLKVNVKTKVPYIEIGDSNSVKQGEKVYAIGNPLGLSNTMSEGIISNTNRVLDGVKYIQISVPINHGSSGGALINEKGQVVGITSAGFETTGDLNLAIPINKAKTLNWNKTEDLILFSDSYYEGFNHALDFGQLFGVDLIKKTDGPVGSLYEYDMFDFHTLNNMDDGDRYAHAIYFYCMELQEHGFKHTEVINDIEGIFEHDEEIVIFHCNYDTGIISVEVMKIPRTYKEFAYIPDFGAFSNLSELPDRYVTDNSIMYVYKWTGAYTRAGIHSVMTDYFEILEIVGHEYLGYKDYGTYQTYVFQGYGKQIYITEMNTYIYIDVFK